MPQRKTFQKDNDVIDCYCIYEHKHKGSYFGDFGLAFVFLPVDIFEEVSCLPSFMFTVFLLKKNKQNKK